MGAGRAQHIRQRHHSTLLEPQCAAASAVHVPTQAPMEIHTPGVQPVGATQSSTTCSWQAHGPTHLPWFFSPFSRSFAFTFLRGSRCLCSGISCCCRLQCEPCLKGSRSFHVFQRLPSSKPKANGRVETICQRECGAHCQTPPIAPACTGNAHPAANGASVPVAPNTSATIQCDRSAVCSCVLAAATPRSKQRRLIAKQFDH